MRIAYLDVFCGLSGDMFLGALFDAGVSPESVEAELRRLPLPEWHWRIEEIRKGGLRGLHVSVEAEGWPASSSPSPHGGLSPDEIIALIRQGSLRPDLATRAVAIIERVAEAEASVHGVAREAVHFHELGGLDTIIDVCGVLLGLDLLGVECLYCSPLPMSYGFVETAHGRLPVPPPAVAYLLRGVPTFALDVEGETVTPTGAALAVGLAEFGLRPPMTITSVGVGAGTRDFPIPNLVRLFVGEPFVSESGSFQEFAVLSSLPRTDSQEESATPTMILLEANLDDMSAELFGYAMEQIFAAGAMDVWATPIYMKKNRPGTMLSALAPPERADAVAAAILRHTTSFGVRQTHVGRRCLEREHISVSTPFGPVRIKIGRWQGEILTASPEYEDCVTAAQAHNVPLKSVYAAAIAAFAQHKAEPKA